MNASTSAPPVRHLSILPRSQTKSFEPDNEWIKRRLLRRGVFPTPKILHALRKKEIQKAVRRSKKQTLAREAPPVSESQNQLAEEEALFRTVSREYRAVKKELEGRNGRAPTVGGRPWERSCGADLRGSGSVDAEYDGGKLKVEHLEELRELFGERNGVHFSWLLDDDIEEGENRVSEGREKRFLWNRKVGDEDKIQLLVHRLSSPTLSIQDWKFSRLMKQSGILFSEPILLRIIEKLGTLGNWRQAMYVVEWVYNQKAYKHSKSRFVYTKLLAVLGKGGMPREALRIFNLMREDCQIYPDMPAYHSIAVTLGQAGYVKELINVLECMKQKPSKRLKNMRDRNWDPCLEPDVVVYNAVLNACIPTSQWKGVFWVLGQMRHNGVAPNGATYGLAMEVMLKSGKHDLVHKFFGRMQRSGLALRGLTYKVLVRTFWEEGKVDEAIGAVRDMEQKGIVGTASVYYELVCCLCNNGRWKEAMLEVEKLKRLPLAKPLVVTFTGMIQYSMDGGHLNDCISIFELMKVHCAPNIGTVNAMLKVYGRSDMFAKAKELFEATKKIDCDSQRSHGAVPFLSPDAYSYGSMLEASACAHQWEYFEYLYKEMALCGYQIDQNKHACLLVEASRAGKWHLLEHAFNTILEAGEIPHTTLFTGMICQNLFQQNYERAVSLITSMAHASMSFSEKQWTKLFQKYRDWISNDKLLKLLHVLDNSNTMTEEPVCSLLKALKLICKSQILNGTSRLAIPSDILGDNSTSQENDVPRLIALSGNGTGKPGSHEEDNKFEITSGSMPASLSSRILTNSTSIPHDLETYVTEATLDLLTGRGNISCGSDLPSPSEILELWKESRKKDGSLLSRSPSLNQ